MRNYLTGQADERRWTRTEEKELKAQGSKLKGQKLIGFILLIEFIDLMAKTNKVK